MCIFTPECDGTDDDYWEGEPSHFGGESLTAFGCASCGYSDCL